MKVEGNTPYELFDKDISFDFLNQNITENISIQNKHILVLVYEGELIIQNDKQQISLKKGECVFLRGNSRIILIKKLETNEIFKGIMLGLGYNFLKDFYHNIFCKRIRILMDFDKTIIKLASSVYIESLYISLKPYLNLNIKPDMHILTIKSQEAIYCLLSENISLYIGIFNSLYLPESPCKFNMN